MKRQAVVQKCREKDKELGKPWCVYSKDESKLLGRHKTKSDALDQLSAIEISKHSRLRAIAAYLERP